MPYRLLPFFLRLLPIFSVRRRGRGPTLPPPGPFDATILGPMHEYLRHRVLGGLAMLVSRRSGWVLGLGVAAAIASIAIAVGGVPWLGVSGLRFQSDRNDLIDADLSWNRRFIDWAHHFPGHDDLFVVIDRGDRAADEQDQGRRLARALAAALEPALLRSGQVARVVWRFRAADFSPRALRLAPMDRFEADLTAMTEAAAVLDSATPARLLVAIMGSMQRRALEGTGLDASEAVTALGVLARLTRTVRQTLANETTSAADWEAALGGGVSLADTDDGWVYQESGRLLLMRVTPHLQSQGLDAGAAAVAGIRKTIEQVGADHPEVEAGLTGIDAIETDETAAATHDSAIASIVAAIVISAVLVAAFHGWRMPLLIMIALTMGIAWSFGYVTLMVGHLQVISVVFTVILLGLGVAYGIHVASRFELIRHDYADGFGGVRAALRDSLETMGPGVVTGAVTTAAAFCTTMLTEFRGVAEMGHIAAAGIFMCLAAMLLVFPAMLRRWTPRRRHHVPLQFRHVHLFDERWIGPFARHPLLTLLLAATLTVASLAAVLRMRFDYDLLRLLPRNVASIRWQQRIARHAGHSIWTGIAIVDDLDEARDLVARMRTQPRIAKAVRGVGLLLPPDEDRKLRLMAAVRERLGDGVAAAAGTSPGAVATDDVSVATALGVLRVGVAARLSQDMPEPVRAALGQVMAAIDACLGELAGLGPAERLAAGARLQQVYTAWRRGVASRIAEALDPAPLTLDDVPADLMRPYVAGGGRLALEIQPAMGGGEREAGGGPLHPDVLGPFCEQMAAVDPNVTGSAVQIYRSGNLISTSYIRAGCWALLVVFVFVLLDFQRLGDAVLSLMPVGVGFALTFGVMWLLGMQINPANIIVLPLMFGIGVDSGVHALHRYRQDPVTRPLGLSGGTGKGITLTSLTAMIGFGAMLLARHRGIASLGFVLTVGIGLTMLSCWTVVPACLELRSGRRAGGGERRSDEATERRRGRP